MQHGRDIECDGAQKSEGSTALFKKREFHTRAGERVRLILTKRKVRSFGVEPGIIQMRNKLTFTPQQSSVYDYMIPTDAFGTYSPAWDDRNLSTASLFKMPCCRPSSSKPHAASSGTWEAHDL
jgi:hypothetical protein